jgi:cell division protein FtsW (lipid II flippase)
MNQTHPTPSGNLSGFPKKYLYLTLVLLLLVQLYNLQPLSSFKTGTIEYTLHFYLMGVIFWLFAALLLITARTYYLNTNKYYRIPAAIFLMLGIALLILPFFIYHQVVGLDASIHILDQKADSLRKIGK